jgi:hypothetical protein
MYQLHQFQGSIRRLTDGADFPESDDCQAYIEYKKWVAEGNTPAPPTIGTVSKPTSVTMRQARLALLQAGYYSSVQTAINAIEDPVQKQASQIEWEYAATVDRNSSFTQGMATALGLSEQDMDNLFMLAASL